jgi:membrane protease YdiL (CAAX protease family)
MGKGPGRLSEWALAVLCVAAGAFFFASLGDLWPLADADLTASPERLRTAAREFLGSRGFDLTGHHAARRLVVETPVLDYVETHFGRDRAQEWIRNGWPLVFYRVQYKKHGETIWFSVELHPSGNVIGWNKVIQEDYPGARLPVRRAREMARRALDEALGLDPRDLEEKSASTSEQIDRRTHRFGFERTLSEAPELRERVTITVAVDEVVAGARRLLVPEAARRETRARQAPAVALETLGFAMVAVAAVAAFFIFLRGIRSGAVRLWRAAVWPALVFVCLMATFMLQTASLFSSWEPLWPRWVSYFRYFVGSSMQQAWLLLFLLALVAAGDVMDGRIRAGRGESLWILGRGELFHPRVARASGRGFLIGLLCGGVMALAVGVLQWLAGGETALQPRGFFFYTLNSASPAAASLLFFFGVALAEELGYRYFGGSWMLALTGRRWVAVLMPALMYGLTHTRMDFLPPAQPFWARAVVLTLVGCVWGWAFLRYDALTVVLSHFTADLFIFNWPRLASGEPGPTAMSVLTICVPLIPAIGRSLLSLTESSPEQTAG